jgi:hypothetical protein
MSEMSAPLNAARRFVMYHHTYISNLVMGAGFAYAISNEKPLHLPVVYIFPSIYAGYQLFRNQDAIFEKVKKVLH